MDLTLARLKSRLHYDPKTGKWINRVWRGNAAHAGCETGRPNTDGYIQICIDGKRWTKVEERGIYEDDDGDGLFYFRATHWRPLKKEE